MISLRYHLVVSYRKNNNLCLHQRHHPQKTKLTATRQTGVSFGLAPDEQLTPCVNRHATACATPISTTSAMIHPDCLSAARLSADRGWRRAMYVVIAMICFSDITPETHQ